MNSASSKTLAARTVSFKPTQITSYLTGAVGAAAFLGAPHAEAEVVAVEFGFGSVLDLNTPQDYFVFTGASVGSLEASGSGGSVWLGNVYNIGFPGDLVTFFNNDTIIGSGGNGNLARSYLYSSWNASSRLPTSQGTIAFKTSTNNWGYANVSWDAMQKALTVNSAFVETAANTPITIVPEPSRALLALAGLGGVALRRRRKQAA